LYRILLIPLVGRFLGRGINGGVYETTIRGVNLALKKVYVRNRLKKSQVAEVEILKHLSHIHIIQIVGTYTQQKIFGCLTYPVALCTLLEFFESVESRWSEPTIDETSYTRLDTLGYFQSPHLHFKATPAYFRIGCILSAVAYLHESKIKRK
jgi:serine/threonine protein kinase